MGYHARTLGRRGHRGARLAVVSGEGRATAVLLDRNRRLLAVAEDFTPILDPPIQLSSISGPWAERIKAVDSSERRQGVDSFRRKFLAASGLGAATVRAAIIVDRPRASAAAEVWAGKAGEDLSMAPDTILDQIRRNPRDRIESWSYDPKQSWRWHLLQPSLEPILWDDVYSRYLAFGTLDEDLLEMERWAEDTGRVEWDLSTNGHHAILRFFSEGFFEAGKPCLATRIYPAAGPVVATPTAAASAGGDMRAMIIAWDGAVVSHISGNLDLTSLVRRAANLATTLRGSSTTIVPLWVLASPTAAFPPEFTHAPAHGQSYEVHWLRKDILAGPESPLRRRRSDLADLLQSDLPGTPEAVLAAWMALRLYPKGGEAPFDDATPALLSESYRARQVARTAPSMRAGAALALAASLAALVAIPLCFWSWWSRSQAEEVRVVAQADARQRATELETYGETTLRLEDLRSWTPQAERWPVTAFLGRAAMQLPASVALREITVRALLDPVGNPRGYEMVLSGQSRPDGRAAKELLGETFPGASVREIPASNPSDPGAGATEPTPGVPWRCVVSLDFARLRPADYPVEVSETGVGLPPGSVRP